jgi:hypothetical protein
MDTEKELNNEEKDKEVPGQKADNSDNSNDNPKAKKRKPRKDGKREVSILYTEEQYAYLSQEADKLKTNPTDYVRQKSLNKNLITVEKFHILDILERVEKIHNLSAATFALTEADAKANGYGEKINEVIDDALEKVKMNKRENMES